MASCVHPNHSLSTTMSLIETILKSTPRSVLTANPRAYKSLKYYHTQAGFIKSLSVTNVGLAFPKKAYLTNAERKKARMIKHGDLTNVQSLMQYKMLKNTAFMINIRKVLKTYPDLKVGTSALDLLSMVVNGVVGLKHNPMPAPKRKTAAPSKQDGGMSASDVILQTMTQPNMTPYTHMIMHILLLGFSQENKFATYDAKTDMITVDYTAAARECARKDAYTFTALMITLTTFGMGAVYHENANLRKLIRMSMADVFGGKKQKVAEEKKILGFIKYNASVDAKLHLVQELAKIGQKQCESEKQRTFTAGEYQDVIKRIREDFNKGTSDYMYNTGGYGGIWSTFLDVLNTSKYFIDLWRGTPTAYDDLRAAMNKGKTTHAVPVMPVPSPVPEVKKVNTAQSQNSKWSIANAYMREREYEKTMARPIAKPTKKKSRPYDNWAKQERPKIKADGFKGKDVTTELSRRWAAMSYDERDRFSQQTI